MTVNKRIQEIIKHYENGKQKHFCNVTGISPTTLSSIIGKRQSDPSCKILNSVLLFYPEISSRWLITGKGEMFRNSESIINNDFEKPKHCEFCQEKEKVNNSLERIIEEKEKRIDELNRTIDILQGASTNSRKRNSA